MATKMNSISSSSSLNPGAREYVPRFLEAKKETERTAPETKEPLPPIESVPRDILETVLSFLDDPRDVASAAMTYRRFAEAAGTAPLRVGLSPPPKKSRRAPRQGGGGAEGGGGEGGDEASASAPPPLSVAGRVRALGACWPGTTALSLGPGPPAADDAAVSLVLRGRALLGRGGGGGKKGREEKGKEGERKEARSGFLFPRLAELRLDRCTKLTSAAFAEEGEDDEEGEGGGEKITSLPPLSRLRLLGADRCFSLSAEALTLALRAASSAASAPASTACAPAAATTVTANPRRRLSSLALSHLDLSEWPAAAPKEEEGDGVGGGDNSGTSSDESDDDEGGDGDEGEGGGSDAPWNEAALSSAVDEDEATPEESAALAWGDAGALDEVRRRRRRRGNGRRGGSSKRSLPPPLSSSSPAAALLGGSRRGSCRPYLLPSTTTNLRCLALTNCSGLTAKGLEALCGAAPLLRVLALGGSSLAASSLAASSPSSPLAPAPPLPQRPPPSEDGGNYYSSSSSSSDSSASALRAAHVGAAMAALASSRGAVAHVGSPGTLWPNSDSTSSSGASPPPYFPSSAGALRGAPLAALRAAIVAEIAVGEGASSSSCGGGGSSAGSLPPSTTGGGGARFGGNDDGDGGNGGRGSSEGALLSCCLRRLTRLRCVELTFWPRGTDSTLARDLETAAAVEGRKAPIVWNLARGADAAAAASAAASPSAAAALLRLSADCAESEEDENETFFEGLRLALAAAANCSSTPGRQSPLHLAAAAASSSSSSGSSSATTVSALVSLGAQPDARDRSGATPAFVAAEAGRECALRALLNRGKADGRARNSAGEAPLYISSLRGHSGAVAALLDFFRGEREEERKKKNSNSSSSSSSSIPPLACWTDPLLYGDGWTPVMAAALGGRKEVLRALLAAAAEAAADAAADSEGSSNTPKMKAAPRRRRGALLVRAANRYGQTALHIAARRGCCESLKALLEASASATGDDDGGAEESNNDNTKKRRPPPLPFPFAAVRDASGDSAADVALRAGHLKAAALLSAAATPSGALETSYDAENVKATSPKWRPSATVLDRRSRRAAW